MEAGMINILNVSKVYQMGAIEVNALNNVSLSVDQGEFIAIVGPSGSGKSTLMNILGCLDVPTSGSYELDGKPVQELSDDELAEIRNAKLGFIFQGFNLLSKLTALENVELPLIYRGIGKKHRRELAKEALAKVGLGNRLNHRPSEMSGGQQQRVAFARAIAASPPIIMADEPTGNLDSKSGIEVMKILTGLNDSGHTIILITHDADVAAMAKRTVTISDGRVIHDSLQKEVLS